MPRRRAPPGLRRHQGPRLGERRRGRAQGTFSLFHFFTFSGAGGLAWGASGLRGGQGEWLRSFGTLPRRAAYNARAVAAVRARFPGAHVVDFEALTAPLPVDYTHDGEARTGSENEREKRESLGEPECGG